MSDDTKRAYFLSRAQLERDLALSTTNNMAAIRHFELAEHYAAKAQGAPAAAETVDRHIGEPGTDYLGKLVENGMFRPFMY